MPITSLSSITNRRLRWDKLPSYEGDGMRIWGKNVGFREEPGFRQAYQTGIHSGHKYSGPNKDPRIEWRVHTAIWAASHACLLEGDFVECGVNTGILSLAICDYLKFNTLDKNFYLFDTFCGIPEGQLSEQESKDPRHIIRMNRLYEDCYDIAERNFSKYPRAQLIKGEVPGTLTSVSIDKVCYLSIDMNIVHPEIAALKYFWPKLQAGAPVVLDDYGFAGHEEQYEAMNRFADEQGTRILELPTGQGLLLKP